MLIHWILSIFKEELTEDMHVSFILQLHILQEFFLFRFHFLDVNLKN